MWETHDVIAWGREWEVICGGQCWYYGMSPQTNEYMGKPLNYNGALYLLRHCLLAYSLLYEMMRSILWLQLFGHKNQLISEISTQWNLNKLLILTRIMFLNYFNSVFVFCQTMRKRRTRLQQVKWLLKISTIPWWLQNLSEPSSVGRKETHQ